MMKTIIREFDTFLYKENYGKKFEAVIVGGAALNFMDVTDRRTYDVDVIKPFIPEELQELAILFGFRNRKYQLNPDRWINNQAMVIFEYLPQNWQERIILIFEGKILKLYTLGRIDLLITKLHACIDRGGNDFNDCVKLRPTKKELEECRSWLLDSSRHPEWAPRLEKLWKKLGKVLGHD